jgi:hypothetical protein
MLMRPERSADAAYYHEHMLHCDMHCCKHELYHNTLLLLVITTAKVQLEATIEVIVERHLHTGTMGVCPIAVHNSLYHCTVMVR